MCGRYYIEIDEREMKDIISQVERDIKLKTGEIFPTDHAPVIPPTGVPRVMRWGFARSDGKGQIINARSETAAEKPVFRTPMQQCRCLIPASCYFEWERRGRAMARYTLELPEHKVLYMAGLYRTETDGQETFAILTRPAGHKIAFIHDRMPVILPRQTHNEWLSGWVPGNALAQAEEEIVYRTDDSSQLSL